MSSAGTAGPRLWPVLLILAAVALALAVVWVPDSDNRQKQVIATFPIVFVGLLLLVLWLLFLSRLSGRVRLLSLAVLACSAALGVATLEFRGVSGDIVPLVDWRWAARPATDALVASPSQAVPIDSSFHHTQFLGSERDGTVRGVRLARDWQARPPRELWRRALGAGWSGFAVDRGIAVTQEQRGEREWVTGYDLRTGVPIWAHGDVTRHEDPMGGPGPRATPTIADGIVYALGGTGLLNALDLATGARIWSRDVVQEHGARIPEYGVATSPLVVDEHVVVLAGGPGGHSLVAYDRRTGEPAWSGGDDRAAYSSPVLARLAGSTQIVVLSAQHLLGHAVDDGRVLWSTDWPAATEKVSQPVVLTEDRLFLSTGYGVGGKLLRLRADRAGALVVDPVWESSGLKAKMTNVVQRDRFLYGLDDGILACLDSATGERRWKGGRYGHGQILLVDDLLLVQAEDGDVVLVEATPHEHRELARLAALRDKTWNHPALAGPWLIVRNDREAACYELPLADGAG
jgi:outer membrane protein assembly factor BamB